ncbi:MAG: hypothetical protein R3282_07395, partial [Rhodothermales bacterium]|nr:hypothetical protein [Rhodothermales bacterium]
EETPGDAPAADSTLPRADRSQNRLEEAHFHGDVVVDEDRFHMESQDLRLLFNMEVEQDDALKELEAKGDVFVKGLDTNEGELRSQHLFTEFALNAAGDSLPKRIVASDKASIKDLTQHIRADDHIEFHLVESPLYPAAGDAPPAEKGAFDRVQVERFRAVENVFVELDSGVTATGDLLEGNAILGNADLTGEKVVVDGTPEDVDFHAEGTRARVERIDGRSVITIDGEGRATLQSLGRATPDAAASEPVDEAITDDEAHDDEANTDAPASNAPDPETIDITWNDEFMYMEGAVQGSGTVRFRGDVHAVSIAPAEENVIDAVELTAAFGDETLDPVVDAEGTVHVETRRTLRDLIARGNARMESRVWENSQRDGPYRFTHIRGQYIEYNQQTMSAKVPGAGILLINDPRPVPEQAEGGEQADGSLTGRGATVFEWTDDMHMNQSAGARYDVTMIGNVIMQHDALSGDQDDAYMTCDRLDVALSRRDADQRNPGLDFGGSTEVERFDAKGRVTLGAQSKRIEGNEVTYFEREQIVRIFGTERTDASFKSEPTRPPMRAKGFIWHLDSDDVQMTGLRSTIPR